jgi:Outer membrane protein beta-barrel domain
VSKFLRIFLVISVFSIAASAQKLDLALTIGGYHPVNNGFSSDNAFAIEGNIGARLGSAPFLALYFEVPIAGTLDTTVPLTALSSTGTYSSIFVTPGVRLKFVPSFPISPYIATGGGLAHFSRSASQTPAGASNSVNKGVWDIGGGLDLKIGPFLGLRGEVRDFYSGSPELRISQVTGTFDQRQHNIIFSGGLVVRF